MSTVRGVRQSLSNGSVVARLTSGPGAPSPVSLPQLAYALSKCSLPLAPANGPNSVAGETTRATTAEAGLTTTITAETVRAEAAEATLTTNVAAKAPSASPVFTGSFVLPILAAFVDDTAAAVGGIVLGQLYWSSTVNAIVQRRV